VGAGCPDRAQCACSRRCFRVSNGQVREIGISRGIDGSLSSSHGRTQAEAPKGEQPARPLRGAPLLMHFDELAWAIPGLLAGPRPPTDPPEPVNSSVCTKVTGVRIAGGQAVLSTGWVAHRCDATSAACRDGGHIDLSYLREKCPQHGRRRIFAPGHVQLGHRLPV
jgi:hypothetical protein